MAPTDNDQDSRIDRQYEQGRGRYDPQAFQNQEQAAYDREFNDIADNYNTSDDPSAENDTIAKLKSKEEAPWTNNVSGYGGTPTAKQSAQFMSRANMKAILKKRGVWGLLAVILLGGGTAGIVMLSPALLIVNMKEVMVKKFNMQLASMEDRTGKLLNYKMSGATSGLCTSVVSVKCKYSTMSKEQVAAFKDAGIEVQGEPLEDGRVKPKNLKFNNQDIPSGDFAKIKSQNTAFAAALRKAYNPTYMGFSDKVWDSVRSKLGISKADPKEATSDKDRAANLDEETRNGMQETSKAPVPKAGDPKPGCTPSGPACQYSETEVQGIKDANAAADSLTQQAADAAKAGKSSGQAILADVAETGVEAAKGGLTSFTNFFKVTGYVDNACQAYGAIQAVGYAAKTVRAIQLARYAMAFLKTADMIKAGTAKPGDVAYMGGILTEITYDAKSAASRTAQFGAATDSFGYKYAAYGDLGGSSKSRTLASQFLVGGGLTGDLINFSNLVNDATGGTPKKTCKLLNQPIVSAASFVGGVAMLFVPGAFTFKSAVQIAGQAAFTVGMMILPQLLKDIVAGTVADSNTKGEAAGDAITSGSGYMMSELAGAGGNAPMTPDQAVAYDGLQNETLAYNAQLDRATLSPLDPTNSNTFMGSFITAMAPSLSNMSSLSGIFSSMGSIFSASVRGLVPQSFADTPPANAYTQCPDLDYKDLKGDGTKATVAADPFCNILRGIPPKYLTQSPESVINDLVSRGQLDDKTDMPIAGSEYETFTKDCIERDRPLGDAGSDQAGSTGAECLINDHNANFYVHYVDRRVNDGMDSSTGGQNT